MTEANQRLHEIERHRHNLRELAKSNLATAQKFIEAVACDGEHEHDWRTYCAELMNIVAKELRE